jgi:hypothetical protein
MNQINLSRQSHSSRQFGRLTVCRRCVIPTALAHRQGALSHQPGDARIPYDDLSVFARALLRVIRIMEWPGRLRTGLRRAAALRPAYRLGKIEAPQSPTPRTRIEDSRSKSISQSLYHLIRLIAVFRFGPAAQGTERRNLARSLLIHYIAVEEFASLSDRADPIGAARRLDRRRRPSTGLCPPDMGRIGSEKNPVGGRALSI